MSSRPLPQRLGKYEVRREVGRGGMGVVYEGFDPVIGRRVALKTFITDHFDGTRADNLLTRLRREAQAAGRLSHPNIIAVYDYGEEVVKDASGAETITAFIAMEFIEGRSLESYFEANERFPMSEIDRILSELLDALGYSHEHGVVHRDIKPANIILLADGTVKVADFGVARLESSTLTQVGTVLGSPSYMSPEQFMGQTVDGRSDLYSAGVVLYQLLTAEIPFAGAYTTIMHRVLNEYPPPPSALNVQVPRGFDAVLRRALAKRPDERYQTAAEFAKDLAQVSAGAAPSPTPLADPAGGQTLVRAPQSTAAADAAKPALRPAMLATLLAVAAVGVAAAYLGWRPHATSPPAPPMRSEPAPPSPETAQSLKNGDAAIISAVGVVGPAADPRQDPTATERMVWLDARRQLIAKAAALYVQPSSLNANYAIVRTKLLAHSDDFITGVLQQQQPQTTRDGATFGILRASVSVRDVQKSLNQISHDERVEFIRNNGNPKIAVSVRTFLPETDAAAGPQRSSVAENLLKERIRSFGFTVVDADSARPVADFRVDSEVRFKKLSAKLPASGLVIEKFLLTSWTVRAVDVKSGEEIYHNTTMPEKQGWATEELALQDVGRLIGAEFSQSFFLQYFDFKPKKARLRFSGLPPSAANAVLAQINGNLIVLNAALAGEAGGDVLIDTELSAGSTPVPDLVQQSLLGPLNKQMGTNCFTLLAGAADAAELHIAFDAKCSAATNHLESAPRDALADAHATSL